MSKDPSKIRREIVRIETEYNLDGDTYMPMDERVLESVQYVRRAGDTLIGVLLKGEDDELLVVELGR